MKDEKRCPHCKVNLSLTKFYKRRNRPDFSVYCKKCTGIQILARQRNFKLCCVQYKGGRCEKCGYDKCYGALEFHHRNPREKDFGIAKWSKRDFHKNEDKIKKELDKCEILCANCHREQHTRYNHLEIEQWK